MYTSAWTYAVLFVCPQLLLAESDSIKYKVTNWNKCIESQSTFVKLIGVSIQECVNACVKRHTCQSVAYRSRMNLCELHKDDSDTLVTHPKETFCVFVQREDMGTKEDKCKCTHVGHVCNLESGQCEIKECGKLDLPNGKVYGNVYDIGAQLKVTCLQGYVEPRGVKQVTCNLTGNWDPTPTCEAAGTSTALAVPSATATSIQSVSTTTQPSGVATFNIYIESATLTQTDAKLRCNSANRALVEINSIEKWAFIKNKLNSLGTLAASVCYWIDGTKIGEVWKFENGTLVDWTVIESPTLNNGNGKDCLYVSNTLVVANDNCNTLCQFISE